MLAAAAPAGAGPTGWAHQAAGFQSNGAVTVKSLAGGSYSGTQNPSGAVAKSNQNAATQAPTVIIQATSGSNVPVMMWTAAQYNGNLGGQAGADAKCQAEFGAGWKFAEMGKLVSGVPVTGSVQANGWITNTSFTQNCSNWTNGTSGQGGPYMTIYGGGSAGAVYWTTPSTASCNIAQRLVCVNY